MSNCLGCRTDWVLKEVTIGVSVLVGSVLPGYCS